MAVVMPSAELTRPGRGLYLGLLDQAASEAEEMLTGVLTHAGESMRDDASHVTGLMARDHLELSDRLLTVYATQLCEQYPGKLARELAGQAASNSKLGTLAFQSLHLDQLELMDDSQVQERVEMARAMQHALFLADTALVELNVYVGALQGLPQVASDSNPLRPAVYIGVLQSLVSSMNVPPMVCATWLQHVSSALGQALGTAYVRWVRQLKNQGVQPIVVHVATAPDLRASDLHRSGKKTGDRAVWTAEHRQTVLTLDRLRRLMAGEFEAPKADSKEDFARQFAREFEVDGSGDSEASDTCFDTTVPAALEAMQEMHLVDQVAQRLQDRPTSGHPPMDSGDAAQSVREQLMASTQDINQRLSLEVVALMIDNLVQDARLLWPIRNIFESVEPALLRLVLIDPRFFIDKKHPARALLQEVAERGLAFGSEDAPEFNAFLLSLRRFLAPLANATVESSEPFERALKGLLASWKGVDGLSGTPARIDSAVAALKYAEKRNFLARKMVAGMRSMDRLQLVPQSVADFLLGPWAQVMACAKLDDDGATSDPGGYKSLVKALLWSAQPELTRANVAKLTQLVPMLLFKLREGLALIDYPSVRTSEFFDVLMKLHQQAFRPASNAAVVEVPLARLPGVNIEPTLWVAPAEAKATGFMAFADEADAPAVDAGVRATDEEATLPTQVLVKPGQDGLTDLESGVDSLAVGCWVELMVQGGWTRTQLTWVSQQRTMYLFTTLQGKTQSMTRRMLAKFFANGSLKVISARSIVDGAFDAVVHVATLNSLDLRLE